MVKEEIDEVVKTMEVCKLSRSDICKKKAEFLIQNTPQLFFQDVKTDLEQHGSQIPENDEDKFAEIMGVSLTT